MALESELEGSQSALFQAEARTQLVTQELDSQRAVIAQLEAESASLKASLSSCLDSSQERLAELEGCLAAARMGEQKNAGEAGPVRRRGRYLLSSFYDFVCFSTENPPHFNNCSRIAFVEFVLK